MLGVSMDRVYILTDPSITIPDLNVARSAMELARRIHPEAFGAAPPSPTTRPAATGLRLFSTGTR